MITAAEFIRIFKHYFPDPSWRVLFSRAGIYDQFESLVVKAVEPIDGKTVGQALQVTGSRPTKFEWRWEAEWKDPLDEDEAIPPPDHPGTPGQVTITTKEIKETWTWKEIPVEFERFNLLDECWPEDVAKMAKKMADELRAYGITW